jgi:hypothetical protein
VPYGICQQGDKITEEPIEMPQNKIEEAIATPSGVIDFNYANSLGHCSQHRLQRLGRLKFCVALRFCFAS